MFTIKMVNTVTSAHARQQRLERLTQCFMANKTATGPANLAESDPATAENQTSEARLAHSTPAGSVSQDEGEK